MQAAAEFWQWFVAQEEEYLRFEEDQEPRFDRLLKAMHRVQKHLTFEFGPPAERREFILSADGIKEAFAAVVALKNAAPVLKRWEIIAFRPRRFPLSPLQIGEIHLEPAEVEVSLARNGKVVGLYLFLPESVPKRAREQLGFLMLDEALGEYDVESGLGMIEIEAKGSTKGYQRFPLPELAERYDKLRDQLAM